MNRVCANNLKNNFKTVTHVIFDMDGIILDTETLYTQVTQSILDPYGKLYTPDVKRQVMGLHGTEVAQFIVDYYELPITPDEYIQKAYEKMSLIMPHANLLPGVEKFVTHLHKNNVPIAVATSSSVDSYQIKAKNHQKLFSLFNHKVFGGSDPEVKSGKPNPDIFLVCAARFPDRPSPDKCLVLEDSPNGVTAAIRAGMQCVMIPDKNVITPELTSHATVVIDSMSDLKPEDFGLPPYAKNS